MLTDDPDPLPERSPSPEPADQPPPALAANPRSGKRNGSPSKPPAAKRIHKELKPGHKSARKPEDVIRALSGFLGATPDDSRLKCNLVDLTDLAIGNVKNAHAVAVVAGYLDAAADDPYHAPIAPCLRVAGSALNRLLGEFGWVPDDQKYGLLPSGRAIAAYLAASSEREPNV